MGFETGEYMHVNEDNPRVNLPRWGLKRNDSMIDQRYLKRVNLPRWGLKLQPFRVCRRKEVCKFTPLGFETFGLDEFIIALKEV